MTHWNLVGELAAGLRVALKELKKPAEFATEPEQLTPVNVYIHRMPPDDSETNYPCVLVEWLQTREDIQNNSIAQIGITCATYAHTERGIADCFIIFESVRRYILENQILAKRFRLVDDLIWQTPESQPNPFFFVLGQVSYEIYQPAQGFFY